MAITQFYGDVLDPVTYSISESSSDNTTALQSGFDASASQGKPLDLKGLDIKFKSNVQLPANAVVLNANLHYDSRTGRAIDIEGSNVKLHGSLRSNGLLTATNVTNANPAVVTCTGHGLLTNDEIMFHAVDAGMVELNWRKFIVAKLTDDTFSLKEITSFSPISGNDFDSTGSGTWSGTASFMPYDSGHSGVFCQPASISPTHDGTWFEDCDISGLEVDGFRGYGLRMDWTRRLRFGGLRIKNCSYAGAAFNSCIDPVADTGWKVENIGPGVGGTAYPVTFSRSYSSPALGLDDAPRSTGVTIPTLKVRNNPYYYGFDTHGGEYIHIGTFDSRNCMGGINLEHATGGGDNVSVDGFHLDSFSCIGTKEAYLPQGPAITVDAQSGASENASGVIIGSGYIEAHGHKNSVYALTPFDGGCFYLNRAGAISIDEFTAKDCSKRIARVLGETHAKFAGAIITDMEAVGGYDQGIVAASSDVLVQVGPMFMDGDGEIVSSSWDNLRVDGNMAITNGASVSDTSTLSVMDTGALAMMPIGRYMLESDGTEVWRTELYDLGATVSRIATGRYSLSLPGGLCSNLRVGLDAGAQGARTVEVVNASSTANEIRLYDSAGVLTDYPDVWMTISRH